MLTPCLASAPAIAGHNTWLVAHHKPQVVRCHRIARDGHLRRRQAHRKATLRDREHIAHHRDSRRMAARHRAH